VCCPSKQVSSWTGKDSCSVKTHQMLDQGNGTFAVINLQGGSGGPMLVSKSLARSPMIRAIQAGIVSWRIGCGKAGVPESIIRDFRE
jgi:hypothetical protein